MTAHCVSEKNVESGFSAVMFIGFTLSRIYKEEFLGMFNLLKLP